MTNVDELTSYVQAHPDDYEARWRLAKMLYMAWEYDAALEHLRVLKMEWDRKLNVRRYLAATFYRLGRYEPAIAELEEISEHWPREVPVLQQYARVLEVVGRTDEALAVWKRVYAVDPSHPIAKRVLEQPADPPSRPAPPRSEASLSDSSSGIDIRQGRICRNCGAQNGDEFDRCWQCHATLSAAPAAPPPLPKESAPSRRPSPFWTFLIGMTLVGGLSAASYLLSVNADLYRSSVDAAHAATSYYEALAMQQAMPRLVMWIVAVVAWPLCLLVVLKLAGVQAISLGRVTAIGVALGTLSYVVTWFPLSWLPAGPILIAGCALLLTFSFQDLSIWKSLACWAGHVAAMAAVIIGIGMGTLGTIALTDTASVVRYVWREPAAERPVEPVETSRQNLPADWTIEWRSTGRLAVDRASQQATIRLVGETSLFPLEMTVMENGEEVARITSPPYEVTLPVEPEQPYQLAVDGRRGLNVSASIVGLLRPAEKPASPSS